MREGCERDCESEVEGARATTPMVQLDGYFKDGDMAKGTHRVALSLLAVAIAYGLAPEALAGAPVVTYTAYDAGNQITSITDPRGLVTTYSNDGLGQRWQQSSPDTGTTSSTYDAYGRLASSTRADGTLTSMGYDAVSRLTSISAGGVTHTFTYDGCTSGLGRLCSSSDPTGTTSYTYAPQGWIVGRGFSIGGVSYSIGYGYNNLGQLATLVYPDGNTVSYSYSAGAVTSVQVSIGGAAQSVASSITYAPGGGPMTQWVSTNGTASVSSNDNDGRLMRIYTPSIQDLTFSYDLSDRVTQIADAIDTPMTQSFGYDDMSRLTVVSSPADNENFSYDPNGNRTSETINTLSASVATAVASNQISGLSGGTNVSYGYDANGNITTVNGSPTFHFDAFNRLDSVPTATYYVNAQGQRLRKIVSGASFYFAPDVGGGLLAESNTGAWSDYVWLNGRLIGRVVAGQLEAVLVDQTGRPQVVTNAAGAVVWRARNYAFDRIVTTSTSSPLNLGFPGQYYDAESGLWNNGFRDYSASLGRYIESDPIGLAGGHNTYAYAQGSPLDLIDPTGLDFYPTSMYPPGIFPSNATTRSDYIHASVGLYVVTFSAALSKNGTLFWGYGAAHSDPKSVVGGKFGFSITAGKMTGCPKTGDQVDNFLTGASTGFSAFYGVGGAYSMNAAGSAVEAGLGTPGASFQAVENLTPLTPTGLSW